MLLSDRFPRIIDRETRSGPLTTEASTKVPPLPPPSHSLAGFISPRIMGP
jgi:hypothetical protein